VCNYYSQYLENFAKVAGPLQDLTKTPKGSKKNQKLVWTDEAEEAFIATKKLLTARLELFVVDPDKPFLLETDASDFAIGATLKQFDADGSQTGTKGAAYPVAFFSRKLQQSQQNWSPREKECYAIVSALYKWDNWIGLQPVDVLTDHHSLQAWHSELVDTPSGPSGRKGRWHELFSKFSLSISYIPGPKNTVADAMSRWA
jgi:hypothetical protein